MVGDRITLIKNTWPKSDLRSDKNLILNFSKKVIWNKIMITILWKKFPRLKFYFVPPRQAVENIKLQASLKKKIRKNTQFSSKNCKKVIWKCDLFWSRSLKMWSKHCAMGIDSSMHPTTIYQNVTNFVYNTNPFKKMLNGLSHRVYQIKEYKIWQTYDVFGVFCIVSENINNSKYGTLVAFVCKTTGQFGRSGPL